MLLKHKRGPTSYVHDQKAWIRSEVTRKLYMIQNYPFSPSTFNYKHLLNAQVTLERENIILTCTLCNTKSNRDYNLNFLYFHPQNGRTVKRNMKLTVKHLNPCFR